MGRISIWDKSNLFPLWALTFWYLLCLWILILLYCPFFCFELFWTLCLLETFLFWFLLLKIFYSLFGVFTLFNSWVLLVLTLWGVLLFLFFWSHFCIINFWYFSTFVIYNFILESFTIIWASLVHSRRSGQEVDIACKHQEGYWLRCDYPNNSL